MEEMTQNTTLIGMYNFPMDMTSLPVTIGEASYGHRIYIQSQIHSNETHGTPVLLTLIERLKMMRVTGEVIIWPCVNRVGFYSYCVNRNGLFDPDSGQNWNRVNFLHFKPIIDYFNDKIDQMHSISDVEKTVNDLDIQLLEGGYGINKNIYNFFEPLKNALKSKYFIDVHTPEFGVEHLYCNAVSSFVCSFDINPIILDDTDAATFRNFMSKLYDSLSQVKNRHCANYFSNKEIVSVELPSHMPIDDEYISYWTERLISILGATGFITDKNRVEKTTFNEQFHDIASLKYYYANIDGVIILTVPVGTVIDKNDLIMVIVSLDGTRQFVRAVKRGKFLCFRDKKTILRGEWVARVLEYE